MRRLLLISNLLFISFYCFAQENLPGKIIGKIPDKYSAATYQIQVGAYTIEENAEEALERLTQNGLAPVTEQYLNFTRVIVPGIPANQVTYFLVIIKRAGFNEVIIREEAAVSTTKIMEPTEKTAITGTTEKAETSKITEKTATTEIPKTTEKTATTEIPKITEKIAEKWEINTPNSPYAWFEFNHDMYYIAVENNADKTIHFGKYTTPDKDTINMENWGVVKIINKNNDGVRFAFSPLNEPEKEVNLAAVKAKTMPSSPKLELISRTWKVVNCTEPENIGSLLMISNAGTYLFTIPDEKSNNLSNWRWFDDTNEEFEYSHDNWNHYGRVKITNLTKNSLGILDPGLFNVINGYSQAAMGIQWELVPASE